MVGESLTLGPWRIDHATTVSLVFFARKPGHVPHARQGGIYGRHALGDHGVGVDDVPEGLAHLAPLLVVDEAVREDAADVYVCVVYVRAGE